MLQLSNSSTIRYAQLFPQKESITVFCNRGTSGIDGSTSTAIGASMVVNRPTVFVTGDLSFFYDSNALWNRYTPSDFRIIIINNAGGGIFRILPGPKNTPVLIPILKQFIILVRTIYVRCMVGITSEQQMKTRYTSHYLLFIPLEINLKF